VGNLVEAYGGTVSTLTRKLASLGCKGKYPNNVERDLFRALEVPVAPYYVEVPTRCQTDREKVVLKRIPLLLPHQLYHYMFEADACISDIYHFIFTS
jgi:hypothetical protein